MIARGGHELHVPEMRSPGMNPMMMKGGVGPPMMKGDPMMKGKMMKGKGKKMF